MKPATLLLILLSHQGFWVGGQEQTISVRPAIQAKIPDSKIIWELSLSGVTLAHGEAAFIAGSPTVVKIVAPQARARCKMIWTYRLMSPDGNNLLDSGDVTISLFPPVDFTQAVPALRGKRIELYDPAGGISMLLKHGKIEFGNIGDVSELEGTQADMVIVGPDALGSSPFEQARLLAQAREGAQVLILQQRKTAALGGYSVRPKPAGAVLSWRKDHALFSNLEEDDLRSWTAGVDGELWAIQLPPDEPALEVTYWPRESPGKQPVPLDALLAIKAVGRGRIIFSQIPLGDCDSDPRSQIFLYNALRYLATRPQPTPPPRQRTEIAPPAAPPVSNIAIPPGDAQ